jgi:dipeptidyl-peptidase-3
MLLLMRNLWLTVALAASALTPVAFSDSPPDRVDTTAFIQLHADSFKSLSPQQQALTYWLAQASIAINPIIYDQSSRYGLRQKRVLEAIVSHPQGIKPEVYAKVAAYTKLFWANRGNHNEMTSQKNLPTFTYEELVEAAKGAGHADLLTEIGELRQSFFDANFEPMVTAKSPSSGKDILQASSNNFYFNVSLADLKGFTEKYPLNSRVTKENGKLIEQVYRAGTPDGKVPPGLYAKYLTKANEYLAKAREVADPGQAKAIDKLIRYYQTGEFQDLLAFDTEWVQNNASVDFINGFIEVYMDPRGAKGTSQSFVTITDEKINSLMTRIAQNAQYFETRAPWLDQYKNLGVKPPLAKAVEAVVETGDFLVSTVGDNLPNESEIHDKYGSKSFLFTGSQRALDEAMGQSLDQEFSATPEIEARYKKYGAEAAGLTVALHEIIGHGSGKLSPKLTHEPGFYLKNYFSTLEEARADLMAYWNIGDPKLKELGLVTNQEEVMKAMYERAASNLTVQLRRIPRGDTIEEDHQRGRQMIAKYIMDKTGAIAIEKSAKRNGKTYVWVKDFAAFHKGAGMLLAELMRIKAEGDYEAIKKLIDTYGTHFDPALRDEIVARYKKLNLPTYFCGINADLSAKFDATGKVTAVTLSYPQDFVKQQLGYSRMWSGQ